MTVEVEPNGAATAEGAAAAVDARAAVVDPEGTIGAARGWCYRVYTCVTGGR